jgi:TolB protein
MSAMRRAIGAIGLMSMALRLSAQGQITLGVRGSSAAQPGLVVLAGPGLDSVRTIVQRDLMNSNRFTMAPLTDSAGTLGGPLDPAMLKNLGLTWAVELQPAINGVEVKLYDVATGIVRQQGTRALDASGAGDTRIMIHRVSDQVVTWTGGIGIAATRIGFKVKSGSDDGIWRIDSDGANLVRVTPRTDGIRASPSWSPDGGSIAYSESRDGRWTLFLQRLASGTRTAVTSSAPGDSYGGNFSPDGKSLVFSHGLGIGAAIETVDITRNCCAHELTHDRRNADNVSPSYSPDGRHIAYISNRTGTPEIWIMDDDGASSDQLVPSEFGTAGRALATYSPAWSPDGTRIVFARDVDRGGRQLFTASVAGGQVVQRTAEGQNEDPSWAPDSRHVVFKSKRTGREQLWILDIESGAFRQLTNTVGGAQYPAWSRLLGTNP